MKNLRIMHLLLVATMMAVPSVSKAFMVDGIEYNFYDDFTASVIHCIDNDTVRIPSHVTYEGNTYTVTSIRDFYNPYWNAYDWCKTVHVSLPNTVKTIEDEAFKDATDLRSIELGDSIVSIGASAFENCWLLDNITIPGTVTSLGKRAFATCWHLSYLDLSGTSISKIEPQTFSACPNLETVDLPSSVTTIEKDAFGAARIKYITLPEGVTTIDEAFSDCDSLKWITLPESLTTIDGAAFWNCVKLDSLFIPRGVNTIAQCITAACSGLKSLVIDSENPIYDSRDGCNAIILTAENKLIQGSPTAFIPESVTAIGDYAFWATYIPSTFTIPNSVRTIGNKAFMGTKFVNLIIPDSTEWIGDQSFDGCRSLTSLTLPAALTHIGDKAFYGCQALKEVKVYQSEPLAINENVFENKAYQNGTLHVPVGCADKFRAAVGWSRFSHIIGDIILPNPADVNGDGEINIADANNVVVIIINGGGSGGHGHAPQPEGEAIIGDVNGDGEVNMADVNAIISIIQDLY